MPSGNVEPVRSTDQAPPPLAVTAVEKMVTLLEFLSVTKTEPFGSAVPLNSSVLSDVMKSLPLVPLSPEMATVAAVGATVSIVMACVAVALTEPVVTEATNV